MSGSRSNNRKNVTSLLFPHQSPSTDFLSHLPAQPSINPARIARIAPSITILKAAASAFYGVSIHPRAPQFTWARNGMRLRRMYTSARATIHPLDSGLSAIMSNITQHCERPFGPVRLRNIPSDDILFAYMPLSRHPQRGGGRISNLSFLLREVGLTHFLC